VSCSFLSPDGNSYTLAFKNNRAVVTINTSPKPLVLTVRADGIIVGPGPVEIIGVVATGYDSGLRNASGMQISASEAATSSQPVYNENGQRVSGTVNLGHSNFSARRATCPAQNLSSKGAGVGIETMEKNVLSQAFGGETGPPTPPGVRMHGIFAASTGFSAQFFPESVILGCGPDAARTYPYTVIADGTKAIIKIDAQDHPLALAFRPDGSLDPGSSEPYQVHGRAITGQDDNGDFTFVPLEKTCDLAVLTPSHVIPSGGGSAPTTVATAAPAGSAGTGTPAARSALPLSTPNAPTGNAILSVASGFPAQPGAPNPLAGRPYVLLRDSYVTSLTNGGVTLPAGMSPYKYVGTACATRTPNCQKSMDAIKAEAASAVRADFNGRGTFPGVPPGTYYLMISARYNNQSLTWSQAVQLAPGSNSITLDLHNATPLN
jgi:hypothetical protein